MSIALNKLKPVILIDTSYFIFYRYFSTLKWYQYNKEDINYETITDDEDFMNAFYKHILADFKKLCKTWKTTMTQVIFCYDCPRESIWRNSFTNGYKNQRVPSTTFNPNIFTKFYGYIEETFHNKIAIDNLEADDVVFLTKKMLQENGFDKEHIVIITNDNDYLQIIDEQTKIFNMSGNGNDITKRSCGNPKKDLKMKIIMGDKSDNIQPIHKGIGAITANKLASLTDEDLETYLSEKGCKDIFDNNKLLIDFDMIPAENIEKFKSMVNILLE
jgi:5'-3' exonuclease